MEKIKLLLKHYENETPYFETHKITSQTTGWQPRFYYEVNVLLF